MNRLNIRVYIIKRKKKNKDRLNVTPNYELINLSSIFKKKEIFPRGEGGSIRDSDQYSLLSTLSIPMNQKNIFPSGTNTIERINRRLEINRNIRGIGGVWWKPWSKLFQLLEIGNRVGSRGSMIGRERMTAEQDTIGSLDFEFSWLEVEFHIVHVSCVLARDQGRDRSRKLYFFFPLFSFLRSDRICFRLDSLIRSML